MSINETIQPFLDDLAAGKASPGGGSAAAAAGAMGAALVSMVCNLTIGKKKFAGVEPSMIETREKAESLRAELAGLINEDAEAFAAVMNAFRLPKKTEDDKLNRELAIQAATKRATLSPLATARACADVIELCQTVAQQGNPNAISDAGAAAACAQAGLKAASLNVLINLPAINDREFVTTQRAELDWILNKQVGADEVFALVKSRL